MRGYLLELEFGKPSASKPFARLGVGRCRVDRRVVGRLDATAQCSETTSFAPQHRRRRLRPRARIDCSLYPPCGTLRISGRRDIAAGDPLNWPRCRRSPLAPGRAPPDISIDEAPVGLVERASVAAHSNWSRNRMGFRRTRSQGRQILRLLRIRGGVLHASAQQRR
jgi:hypothetical protein